MATKKKNEGIVVKHDFEKAKKSADSFAYQFKDVFLTQVLN